METQLLGLTPYDNFLFGMKASETKRQYPHRLYKFLTFMELQGTIEEKCTKLLEFSKNNFDPLQSYLIRFINSHKERIENRRTPADFRYTAKFPKVIIHDKRFKKVEKALEIKMLIQGNIK